MDLLLSFGADPKQKDSAGRCWLADSSCETHGETHGEAHGDTGGSGGSSFLLDIVNDV